MSVFYTLRHFIYERQHIFFQGSSDDEDNRQTGQDGEGQNRQTGQDGEGQNRQTGQDGEGQNRQTGQDGKGRGPLDLSEATGIIIYEKDGSTYTVDLSNPTNGNVKVGKHDVSTIDPVKMMRYFVVNGDLYREPLNIGLQEGTY